MKKFHLVKYFEVQVSESELRIPFFKNIENMFSNFRFNFSRKKIRKILPCQKFQSWHHIFLLQILRFHQFHLVLVPRNRYMEKPKSKKSFSIWKILWESLWYSLPSFSLKALIPQAILYGRLTCVSLGIEKYCIICSINTATFMVFYFYRKREWR